jgi:hypothetical protein
MRLHSYALPIAAGPLKSRAETAWRNPADARRVDEKAITG